MSFIIDESDNLNRKIRSSRPISSNELILESRPFLFTVLSPLLKNNCSYCLRALGSGALCAGCKMRGYCGKDCQALDWKLVHRSECKVLALLSLVEKSGKMNTLFLLGLRFLLLKDAKESRIQENLSLLISNKEWFPQEKLSFFREMSIVLHKYLEREFTVESIEECTDALCKFSINAFTIYSHLDEAVALGVFLPSNFINHSCEPNSFVVFSGKTQRIFALRNIEKNEEIVISYSQRLHKPEKNRNFLKENYLFDCNCQKCLKNQEEISARVYEILDLISSRDTTFELKTKLWQELSTNHKGLPREFYGKVLAEISLHHMSDFDYKKAYVALKQFIKCCEGKTKGNEPEIGWKYAELSKIAKLMGKLKPCVEYGEKALVILKRYYHIEDIKELNELEMSMREAQDLMRANAHYHK